jgi:hypothetical protein
MIEICKPVDDCPKCHGTRWFNYDKNHSQPCDLCCPHNSGWWLLKEHYGENNGKWACRAGCGTIRSESGVERVAPQVGGPFTGKIDDDAPHEEG